MYVQSLICHVKTNVYCCEFLKNKSIATVKYSSYPQFYHKTLSIIFKVTAKFYFR